MKRIFVSSVLLLAVATGCIKTTSGLQPELSAQVNAAIAAINEMSKVAKDTPVQLQKASENVIDKLHFTTNDILAKDARKFVDHTFGKASMDVGAVTKGTIHMVDMSVRAYFLALKDALQDVLPKINAEKSKEKAAELLAKIEVHIEPLPPFVELSEPMTVAVETIRTYDNKVESVTCQTPTLSISGFSLLLDDDADEKYIVRAISDKEGTRDVPVVVSPSGPFVATVNLAQYEPKDDDKELVFYHGDTKLAQIGIGHVVKVLDPPKVDNPPPQPVVEAPIEGTLIDSGENKVMFKITKLPPGQEGVAVISIKRGRPDMDYKTVVLKNEHIDPIAKATSEGSDTGREFTVPAGSLSGSLRICLGKYGFAGLWKGIVEFPVEAKSLLGHRIEYTVIRDTNLER